MLAWYRENAPIRKKLSIAFGLESALTAGGVLCEFLAASKTIAPSTALEIGVAAVFVSVALGVTLRKTIADPYVNTVVRMEALAAGNLDAPIHFTNYTDCVGRMTKAMATFRKTALDKIEATEQAAIAATQAEEERQRTEQDTIAQQAALVVGSIGSGLARLAAGELTFRLSETLPAAYEKIRLDFNAAMTKLQDTMQSISTNTEGVRAGAGEITQASDDLARRTEQQAATLEQTAAALDQITATVRRTAEGATEARKLVSNAKNDAERSGEVVRETVGAMSKIETSSKEIGSIIGVIDEIAFQTNLLALNAGVEAARAGDAGRGFAVVATEVRALAQRSADAAKEIKALISTSGTQVDSGVKLVNETGKALERIVAQVGQLNTLVTEIAASAQEQATGLNEVNTAVNQMDQVTQQNAAMVEQATAASHSLANEAGELARLIAQFQTGPTAQPQPVKPVIRAPQQTRSRIPAHAPTQAQNGKFIPMRRPALVTASTGQEDWDEF